MPEVNVKVNAIIEAASNSIANLKREIDSAVNPNSNQFKQMSKYVNEMASNMMKLKNLGDMPFTSQADFKKANNYVNKIQEAEAMIKQIGQGLNFGDMKLTKGQEAEFAALEKELQAVEDRYNAAISKIRANTFTNEFQKDLQTGFGKKNIQGLLNQDLEQVNQTIINKRDALKAQVEEYNKTLSSIGVTSATQQNNLLQNFIKNGAAAFEGTEVAKHINSAGQLKQPNGSMKTQTRIEDIFNALGLNISADEMKQAATAKASEFIRVLQDTLRGLSLKPNQLKGVQLDSVVQNLDLGKTTGKSLETANKQIQALENTLPGLQNALNQAGLQFKVFENENGEMVLKIEKFRESIADVNRSKFNFNDLSSQAQAFKQQLEQVNGEFLRLQRAQSNFNSMKMAITNFMGFYQVLNLTKRAVREAMNHIKELDTVMNGIAIVSPNLNTEDLWQQIDEYSKIAQQYGVTIKGAYEVSKIYYQAGYDSADVMTLMNETLKLSKISGLDYATTTNYMMTATRGFHMEVAEASTVVDVYSNLAQNTAVSQQELAEAMSRTASSMEGVGATFQETSAMIATMEAATRETAYSIGTALKSIASRYGELKKAPSEMIDEDGEFLDYNKVDTALKSVGISLKDSEGQFRNMTDVILELSDVWDTLDSTQQRYIGTQFAGNR